ncbi:MAG: DUF1015 domain-containing protein [Verrucomicrobia bacterium]|nr:MAG: DUF1015 domain-containing protein [Verrucomicrobiota bacterium]
MRIKPFQGLVPHSSKTESVASVPYDVVNTEEARKLASGNSDSLLNISRAEINFDDGYNAYSDNVYEKAKDNFNKLIESNVLVREEEPCVYIYRQIMNGHVQTGLVAVSHVDDYNENIIRKHEKTRPVKEDDRTKLASTLRAHLGPVFLTYRNEEKINQEIANHVNSNSSNVDFVADDGVQHTCWKVSGGGRFPELFNSVKLAYVADGHHRSASAARVSTEYRKLNDFNSGEEDYNWFLTVFFPDSQLKVLPYNRVVNDLNGLSNEEFMIEVEKLASVSVSDNIPPSTPGLTKMFISGCWYELRWNDKFEDPVSCLDVSILQELLLGPVLGIDDPRTNSRINFIGGIRGNEELERLVSNGNYAVAFSMHPVGVSQLMDIADSGKIMPPKSTWFEPKLRSGLFIHTF